MVIATIDLIYIAGFIAVIGVLCIWRSLLIFCGCAVVHVAVGVLSMCGMFPDLPTLTNNNYLVLIHGDVDVYWFSMSVIIYVFILLTSTRWELE